MGSCSVIDTTPIWVGVTNNSIIDTTCRRIRGASSTIASPSSDSLSYDFVFGGDAVTTTNILRCDIKIQNDFTKLRGSIMVTPLSGSTVLNNEFIVSWNSTATSPSTGYIAVGTPYDVVQAGGESATAAGRSFTSATAVTIPEKAVSQTNIIRIEIHEPAGVGLSLSALSLETYSIPTDVVKCVRTAEQ